MASLLGRANFTDRVLLAYFIVAGGLILLQRHRVPGWPAFLLLHAVCIALVGALVLASDRWRTMHAWYPLVFPILIFEEVALLNFLLVDGWRDAWILRFEAWLFPEPPTSWLGRFTSPVVSEILAFGYFFYYLVLVTVAGVLDRRRDKAPFFGVMAASVVAYMVCFVVFVVFPTEGPAHTLRELHGPAPPGGPFQWAVSVIQATAGVHGNAFPSAHAAGAVAALVFAWRYRPRLAGWLTPLVLLMCIGAVYGRYHYASDMIAGAGVGAAAAAFILYAQAHPRWARRLHIMAFSRK